MLKYSYFCVMITPISGNFPAPWIVDRVHYIELIHDAGQLLRVKFSLRAKLTNTAVQLVEKKYDHYSKKFFCFVCTFAHCQAVELVWCCWNVHCVTGAGQGTEKNGSYHIWGDSFTAVYILYFTVL